MQSGGNINVGQGAPANRIMNRIESDIEVIKELTNRLESTTERIVLHARSLGYFEPQPPGGCTSPGLSPVITTLADAIQAISRAVDHCSGSLNLFD